MTWNSKFFTVDEMTASSTAARLGINNSVPAGILPTLADTAERMDAIRMLLGHPIHVDSGYRSPKLNKAVGGVPTSAHVNGFAVDFICPEYGSPLKIVQAIQTSGIKFDQCIMEGNWVHISFAPSMRNQILTAKFVNGHATYTGGVGA